MRAIVLATVVIAGCAGSVGGPANDDTGDGPSTGGDTTPGGDAVSDDGGDGTPATCTSCSSGIASDRAIAWNPGILSDVPLGLPLGDDRLPQRTTIFRNVSPGGDIQAAIDACPDNQVVQLAAGTFTITTPLQMKSNVVLRGAGSGAGGTVIVKQGGYTVINIGTEQDQVCYSGDGKGTNLVADAAKDATTISVGAGASGFAVGDLVLIDQLDVAPVVVGDCTYFKRKDDATHFRSATQVVELTGVDTTAGTLTLGSPLHWPMKAGGETKAQVVRLDGSATTRWAGIESLHIQGGSAGDYPGMSAGGIDISNAAYVWVKDVQTDATIGGMHIRLAGTYRSVVRDSYVHHSSNYGFGVDCYGIVVSCFSADNLVENNIARYMNKPILTDVSGGGNVIAYNYADNSWADNEWQEVNIDEHCSFAHMELIEGNYAPHMGLTVTHGNAGAITYFRNYASSVFASPSVADTDLPRTGNITTLELQGTDVDINVVGNVLGTAGVTMSYDNYTGSDPASIFELGQGTGGAGQTDIVVTSLYRNGNFDYFHDATIWVDDTVLELPPSLYLKAAPTWWPSSAAWPWVGPDLAPMVSTLPAKARSDGM